jgi:hypothetical protein
MFQQVAVRYYKMKVTNITSLATIFSILSFFKAPGAGVGHEIRQNVIPQEGWVGTQEEVLISTLF